MATASETSRLEARVRYDIYELIKEAAELDGTTISAFVINAALKAAEERVEQNRLLRLAKDEQIIFADALLRGAKPPTAAYLEAAALHKKLAL